MQEDELTRLQMGGSLEVREHRAGHFGEGRGVHHVDTIGDRQHMARGHDDVFGIAAAGEQGANFLSG